MPCLVTVGTAPWHRLAPPVLLRPVYCCLCRVLHAQIPQFHGRLESGPSRRYSSAVSLPVGWPSVEIGLHKHPHVVQRGGHNHEMLPRQLLRVEHALATTMHPPTTAACTKPLRTRKEATVALERQKRWKYSWRCVTN
eukprot:5754731-Pleurochrysis_carterae.AAC.1